MAQIAHSPPATLAVVGAGAWGTVLAVMLSERSHSVTLWSRRSEHAAELRAKGENITYLPGVALPENLHITADPVKALNGARAVFMAVPSKGLRETLERLPPAPAFVSCAKGLEAGTFKRLTQIIHEYQPGASLAALSGPNLAKEIAAGKPAAATVASQDSTLAAAVQTWLNGPSFRVYTSADVTGVEVGGAMKNVVALAAGLCDGLGLGDNAKATILTRGLAEIVRLGTHVGGRAETFYGLSGLGDMVATCANAGSRNHTAGVRVARGATLADLEADKLTAEGIPTVRAVVAYAAGAGLELPIAREVHAVIYHGKPPRAAIRDLMTRDAKAEWGDGV